MSEEIDNLTQQLLLAGKYGQSLLIENNEVRALRIMTTCSPVHVGTLLTMARLLSSMDYGVPPTQIFHKFS